MASSKGTLKRMRDVRGEDAPPRARQFMQYNPTYERILKEPETLGGDAAMTELRERTNEEVHRT